MSVKSVEKDLGSSSLEIYLRFNDDMEKDYCLQIASSTSFRDFLKVFMSLPIALRPSIFYDPIPKTFEVSIAPGYLTEDGSLLFSYDASKPEYRKKVALDTLVAKECWPGQLVLPVWEFNYFMFYSFVLFLCAWLYTDLPDFFSPTPGICMTNQMSRVLAKVAEKFGNSAIAKKLIDDIQSPVGVAGQCMFFVFHIVKVIALFFIVYGGVFNPFRLIRIGKLPEITKESLIELGWTGSKRATIDEYKEEYRDFKIKEYGGMVPAHQAGLFNRLKNLGALLGEGEGFNTPVGKSDKPVIVDGKLPMSYDFLMKQAEFFEQFVSDFDTEQMNDAIKQFRRYGLLHSGGELAEIVQTRKAADAPAEE